MASGLSRSKGGTEIIVGAGSPVHGTFVGPPEAVCATTTRARGPNDTLFLSWIVPEKIDIEFGYSTPKSGWMPLGTGCPLCEARYMSPGMKAWPFSSNVADRPLGKFLGKVLTRVFLTINLRQVSPGWKSISHCGNRVLAV